MADGNCHSCAFEAGGFGQRCSRCSNQQFLHNGQCLSNCSGPAVLAATGGAPLAEYRPTAGKYGGECRAPFLCSSGEDETGAMCRCPDRNCATCAIGLAAVECQLCSRGFLDQQARQCVFKCPEGTVKGTNSDGARVCQPSS